MQREIKFILLIFLVGIMGCSSTKKWSPVDTWVFQINDTPMGELHGKMYISEIDNKKYEVVILPNDGKGEIEVKDLVVIDKKLTGIIELPTAMLTFKGIFGEHDFKGTLEFDEDHIFPFVALRQHTKL